MRDCCGHIYHKIKFFGSMILRYESWQQLALLFDVSALSMTSRQLLDMSNGDFNTGIIIHVPLDSYII